MVRVPGSAGLRAPAARRSRPACGEAGRATAGPGRLGLRLPVLADEVADRLVAIAPLEVAGDRRREGRGVELPAHPVDDLAVEARVGLQLGAESPKWLVLLRRLPSLAPPLRALVGLA